jgi:hypothetical protein
VVASNWVGGLLLGGAAAIAGGLLAGYPPVLLLGILCCLMVMPAAVVFGDRSKRSRLVLGVYALALAALGLTAIVLDAVGVKGADTLLVIALLAFFAFMLLANQME